jgi:tyrosinase
MEWPDWIASRPGTPRQRGNLDCMSETQLERLRAAFRCIIDLDPHEEDRRNYNNQALIHQNHCQHGWERFLPWHRAYLYEFEQNLQDFFPNVTLPYWDWTLPNYQPTAKSRDLIPKAFKAYLTEEAAAAMIGDLRPRPTPSQADAFMTLARDRVRFTSQHEFFVYVVDTIGYTDVSPPKTDKNRARMLKALLDSNTLWYPLRYPADYGDGTIASTFRMHFPSADDMAEIVSLNNFRDFGGGSVYDAAFGFRPDPHNTMQRTGGASPDVGASTRPGAKAAAVGGRRPPPPRRAAPRRRALAGRSHGVDLRSAARPATC